mmetsp:Transcript_36381/g.76381  ORF Transcript_36381/g.76381 Transcript_36381/m.76381 type:complete len:213 (-) Transcript_36381:154-792(-)
MGAFSSSDGIAAPCPNVDGWYQISQQPRGRTNGWLDSTVGRAILESTLFEPIRTGPLVCFRHHGLQRWQLRQARREHHRRDGRRGRLKEQGLQFIYHVCLDCGLMLLLLLLLLLMLIVGGGSRVGIDIVNGNEGVCVVVGRFDNQYKSLSEFLILPFLLLCRWVHHLLFDHARGQRILTKAVDQNAIQRIAFIRVIVLCLLVLPATQLARCQ